MGQVILFQQIKKIVEKSNGEALDIEFWRNGKVVETKLKPWKPS